ncbi:hypothetical protein V8G54_020488 [Vigna mungo]|uniref:Retrovirus-related Pol polyprotein from transposon TNT 1-94 n=1 Tax=Vigna mungo TaxID=3915 RepID=A0AAQ3RUR9_VIGMU
MKMGRGGDIKWTSTKLCDKEFFKSEKFLLYPGELAQYTADKSLRAVTLHASGNAFFMVFAKSLSNVSKIEVFSRQNFRRWQECVSTLLDMYGVVVAPKRVRNDNPPRANIAKEDDIIAAVISQVKLMTNVSKWMVDSGATRHICANRSAFTSYTSVGDGEEHVYLVDSSTTPVIGKGKHYWERWVKVSFEYDKIIMTKNNVFVGKGYCDQGLFSNGVAERKNRTLKEMMNVMLVNSSALDNLWGEPLLTACFLQNRIPHKKTGKTPYELSKGYQPNLKYLRVWGCLAKVMLPDPKKRKIGSKTADCMFLGYVEHSAAYRFLVVKSNILERNSIIETKNAEFFEHVFPLKVSEMSHPADDNNHNSDTINEVLRRSKRQREETSFGDDFYIYLVDSDPTSFVEATSALDAKQWDKAIRIEIESILNNNTWTLVDLPKGEKPIGCKWIFKKKYNPDGSIEKYKARLVAKDFTQKPNIDYFDTFAPVTRISSIREEVYMTQPEGCVVPVQEDKKLLKKFGFYDLKPVSTPYDANSNLLKNRGESLSQPQYAQIIRSLLHLMSFSRLDIAYAVGRLSRYTQCPNQEHWDALARLMRCLRGTMDYAIEYSEFPAVLEGYSDANWISDSDETKSTSGYVYTLGGGAITWRSVRQTIIARSTMESEFVSLEMAGSEAEWLKNFLANIPLGMKPTPSVSIHCDCQSVIAIAKNKNYNGKNRHIQLRHNLVKQLLKNGTISIDYVKSERNLADLLTKPLEDK